MSSRKQKHEFRQVSGRAFTIHLRAFGKKIYKLDSFLQEYRREVENVFFRLRGQRFDRHLGIQGMARQIMNVEGSSLEGIQAHAREVKVFAKYLGLIRPENLVTTRGEQYLDAVQNGGNREQLLREYAVSIKIMCPLVRSYLYEAGHNQASYSHYRIRPAYETLYAIKRAQANGVGADTDDIALTSLQFYPPYRERRVTEHFLEGQIDRYFRSKARSGIDYRAQFRTLYDELLSETAGATFDADEFKQKLRNSANNVWCFLVFLRDIGLVDADTTTPSHWSSTQQVPSSSRTFPAAFQELELTREGENALRAGADCVPVWNDDLQENLDAATAVSAVQTLVRDGTIAHGQIPDDIVSLLRRLGVVLDLDPDTDVYVAQKKSLFDPEYDMT